MAREQVEIRSRDGIERLAKELFGVSSNVSSYSGPLSSGLVTGCLDVSSSTSVGAVVWLKSRLIESGAFQTPQPYEDDDVPFMPIGGRHKRWGLSEYARSKMFRTTQIVEPIDLTSLRVARGC